MVKCKKTNVTMVFVIILSIIIGSYNINYALSNNTLDKKAYIINEKGQLISVDTNEIITEENFDPTIVYQVNENGQTYGSSLYAVSAETEPDLILARGIDGTIGYVYYTDLYREEPKNPEEAIAMQKINSRKIRIIPLYASDGKTVIGKFRTTPVQDIIEKRTDQR